MRHRALVASLSLFVAGALHASNADAARIYVVGGIGGVAPQLPGELADALVADGHTLIEGGDTLLYNGAPVRHRSTDPAGFDWILRFSASGTVAGEVSTLTEFLHDGGFVHLQTHGDCCADTKHAIDDIVRALTPASIGAPFALDGELLWGDAFAGCAPLPTGGAKIAVALVGVAPHLAAWVNPEMIPFAARWEGGDLSAGNGVLTVATDLSPFGGYARLNLPVVHQFFPADEHTGAPSSPMLCVPAVCGDGVVQAGEGCDDGNVVSLDACSARCKVTTGQSCGLNPYGLHGSASCVSGVCDAIGNAAPGICENTNTCGNGLREGAEGCDDGKTVSGDGCSASCLAENGAPCGPSGAASCVSNLCNLLGFPAPGKCAPIKTCGNGVLEAGEGCDDGNIAPSDGCSGACRVETGRPCGSNPAGIIGANSCVTNYCNGSNLCALPTSCGNGVLDPGEGCDTAGPSATCTGRCTIVNGSACNNANPGTQGAASCDSGICSAGVCRPPNSCGNSIVEGPAGGYAGEGCDDGGIVDGDGCDHKCRVENGASCNAGQGLRDAASCASGLCNTKAGLPGRCAAVGACGNGVRDATEGCDDGNTTAGDGCSAACGIEDGYACNQAAPALLLEASCASQVCNLREGEGVCRPANTCGNGVRESGEGCDDGALLPGDGCSASCRIETGLRCNQAFPGATGDGSCETGVCSKSGLEGTCVAAGFCGNTAVETGEGCDDGNSAAGDGCSSGCKVETGFRCGPTGNDSCVTGVCNHGVCAVANACGNGRLEAGEGCDDGNTAANDGCDGCRAEPGAPCNADAIGPVGGASCTTGLCNTMAVPQVCAAANGCGNGTLDPWEACDDGNLQSGDGCSATCLGENGAICKYSAACVSGYCGDDRICAEAPSDTGCAAAPGGQKSTFGASRAGTLPLFLIGTALALAVRRRNRNRRSAES